MGRRILYRVFLPIFSKVVILIVRSKFNVDKDKEKRTCDGIVFDSCMEMKFYRDVVLPQKRSGIISNFELQKEYVLQPKFHNGEKWVQPITYVADFYIEYSDGTSVVIDTKGCPDSVAKLKRKLFWYVYPNIEYKWIVYSKTDGDENNDGWCEYEYVQRQRKIRKKKKLEAKEQNKSEKKE